MELKTWPRLECSECRRIYGYLEQRTTCDCGGLLSVEHDVGSMAGPPPARAI